MRWGKIAEKLTSCDGARDHAVRWNKASEGVALSRRDDA
jgi:hypothetical protein